MVKEKPRIQSKKIDEEVRNLILFNDDVNTFEHVIDCLVSICEQTEIQAEQCAFITHHIGKCAVKTGSYQKLKPVLSELRSQGLSVVIN